MNEIIDTTLLEELHFFTKKIKGFFNPLDAQPFIADGVFFLVGQSSQVLSASLFTTVSVDALISGLVDDVVANSSHSFYFLSFFVP